MELLKMFEYCGTAAFALSAVLTAIEYKLDLFGILILSVTTAVGGGLARDIILNVSPPVMFVNPIYCLIALITAVAVIAVYQIISNRDWFKSNTQNLNLFRKIMTLFDAIGLGIFTIVGTNIAISRGFAENKFLIVFVGVLTGVGGGILRDILVSRKPVILSKEVYALASIIGSILYCYLRTFIPGMASVYLCAALIACIRLVAVHKNMNLPQLKKLNI